MRFTFVILLFLSLGAIAKMIIKAHPNYRPLLTGVILDDYSGAAAAYSLRKLRTAYTGSAIRVRRSNDNSEQDIGFTSAGDLDTASLKTFVGANSGFVTTWYNQGDTASINFTQTTAASQPRIVNAGTVERRNGQPSIFFDGSNDFMTISSSTNKFNYLHQTGQSFVSIVSQVATNNTTYILIDNTNTLSASTGYSLYHEATGAIVSATTRNVSGQATTSNVSGNIVTANNLFLLQNELDNNNGTASLRNSMYFNGNSAIQNNASTNTPSTGNASFNLRIGRRANATDFNLSGFMSEILFYNSNQSSNRTGIRNNINSYYGIY